VSNCNIEGDTYEALNDTGQKDLSHVSEFKVRSYEQEVKKKNSKDEMKIKA